MSYTNGLDKPSDYFNTVLYTGNGSTQSITGVGFQPDWVWIKNRDAAQDHAIFDSVRGVQKQIKSNTTEAEFTRTDAISSFDSDGFSIGARASLNGSGNGIVAWNWLASNTTASNTDGSINSTVSVNTTSGFSVVSYSGNNGTVSTVGHGLGVKPAIIIVKNRSSVGDMGVYHHSSGATKYFELSNTNAEGTSSATWNNTEPTTSVFTVGNWSVANASSDNHIAYCFNEVKGFSKFGSFVGTSNQQFIYLGFKPRWFLWKNTSQGDATFDHWGMVDTLRQPYNGNTDGYMRANQSSGESSFSGNGLYFLSNGIQFNNTGRYNNNSGDTYIYMAFAENPFVTSTGIPTCAR